MNFYIATETVVTFAATAVTVIALQTPVSADVAAVLGALLATYIAVVDARQNDRSTTNFFSVLLSSIAVGGIAPGVIFYTWFPDFASRLTWHTWSAAGFIFSLGGWALVQATLWLFKTQSRKRLNQAVNTFLPNEETRIDPPEK